jgi:long-chain acyl-CoA synthetase
MKNKIVNEFINIDYEKLYLITYTSGTSGIPKGVKHSLKNLFLTSISFNNIINFNKDNVFGHVMPMTYMAGILNTIIKPFICGSKIAILGRFNIPNALQFWKVVEKYKINTFWMSPTMLNILLKVDKGTIGSEYCHKNKTIFLIGTAPLSLNVRKSFEEKYGVALYTSYGLSETLFISVQNKLLQEYNDANVGRILDNVEYKLSPDNEILIRVPWMFFGYTNEDTAKYFENDYYKTGDLGEIMSEKALYITGRKKDLIIKGGMNISPNQIVDVINKFEEIDEVIILGEKNNFGEESIICVYSLKNNLNTNEIEQKIRGNVISKLGMNYCIDDFMNLKEIPKNLNGKIDKQAISLAYRRKNDNKN